VTNRKIKMIRPASLVIAIVATQLICLPVAAQVSKEVLDSISTPNEVETSIGTLKFLDGAPYPETADRIYDCTPSAPMGQM